MSIEITCDKCKTQIEGEYVEVASDFWDMPTKDAGQCSPTWCTHGDNFILCDDCYDSMIKEILG